MNILILTAYPPVLNMHGGGVRMFHNIRLLAERHDVRVISFVEKTDDRERLRALDMCESVTAVLRKPAPSAPRSSRYPMAEREFGTVEMRAAIEKAFHDGPVDVLQCEYLQMAQFWQPNVFTILTEHELASAAAYDWFRSETRPVEKLRRYFQWRALLSYEIDMANRFDRVITMTEKDAEFLRPHAPAARIEAIPIGIDIKAYEPRPEQSEAALEVLFFGNFRHTPNTEGARFLAEKVAPRLPDINFIIAGANLRESIAAPANVFFSGYVADPHSLYRRPNTIVAAPLFSGSGQRVKVLEAFAMGCPVVTTQRGAAGFPIHDNRECLIASTAEEFVTAIRRLADNIELRRNLGGAARRMIEDEFSWTGIGARLLNVVDAAPGKDSRSGADSSGWKAIGTRFWGIPNPESTIPHLAASGPRVAGVRQEEHGTLVEDPAGWDRPVGLLAPFTTAHGAGLTISAQIEFHAASQVLHIQRARWLNEPSDWVQLAAGETKGLILAISQRAGSLRIPEHFSPDSGNGAAEQTIGESLQAISARVILNICSRTYPDGPWYTKYFDFELFRDGVGWLHRPGLNRLEF